MLSLVSDDEGDLPCKEATAGTLRRRIADNHQLPLHHLSLLCAAKPWLDPEHVRAESLPARRVVTYGRRYSQHRSELAHAHHQHAERHAEHLRRTRARRLVAGALAFARAEMPRARVALVSVPRETWALVGLWSLLFAMARHLQLVLPLGIVGLCWLMFRNLGQRRAGEASAYSVFNDGVALPGQLQAEEIQRQMIGGM